MDRPAEPSLALYALRAEPVVEDLQDITFPPCVCVCGAAARYQWTEGFYFDHDCSSITFPSGSVT